MPFWKIEADQNDLLHKAIINSINYEPDSIYSTTDGYTGTCWVSEMIDSDYEYGYQYLHFRNFEDLVEFYQQKGYKFNKK